MAYIEREDLITKLNDLALDLIKDNCIQCDIAAGTVVEIKDNIVAKQPTADVVEVRHGFWEQGDYYDMGDVCSECEYDSFREPCNYNYCPHCGAKMDRMDGE